MFSSRWQSHEEHFCGLSQDACGPPAPHKEMAALYHLGHSHMLDIRKIETYSISMLEISLNMLEISTSTLIAPKAELPP